MKNKNVNSNTHIDRDLGASAAIHCSGGKLINILNEGSRHSVFVFENKTSCLKIAELYWNDVLQLPARKYFSSIKELKNQLYSRAISRGVSN
ncbi:MAG: DUF5659 domain-containing protein [Elusimicrobiota bacterium]